MNSYLLKDYHIKQRELKTNYYSILKFILHERSQVIASKYFLGVFPKLIVKFNIQTRHIDSSILWAQLLVTILQGAKVNRLNCRHASGTFVMSTIFSSCSLLRKKFYEGKGNYAKISIFLNIFSPRHGK